MSEHPFPKSHYLRVTETAMVAKFYGNHNWKYCVEEMPWWRFPRFQAVWGLIQKDLDYISDSLLSNGQAKDMMREVLIEKGPSSETFITPNGDYDLGSKHNRLLEDVKWDVDPEKHLVSSRPPVSSGMKVQCRYSDDQKYILVQVAIRLLYRNDCLDSSALLLDICAGKQLSDRYARCLLFGDATQDGCIKATLHSEGVDKASLLSNLQTERYWKESDMCCETGPPSYEESMDFTRALADRTSPNRYPSIFSIVADCLCIQTTSLER